MNQPIDEISCCNCTTCQGYIKGLEKRLANLEGALLLEQAINQQALKRVEELEARVDSLALTLDILQKVIGVEFGVLVTEEGTHEGQCEKCDHVGPLQNGICEGCFFEEIGV